MPKTESLADWRPGAGLDTLQLRATLMARIRRFFHERGVLEVDTPLLATAATTDPAIESFHTRYSGPAAAAGRPLFLGTSPEFFMKRLLAAGSGPIYQLAHVCRNGEYGVRHNPEFMMLEWYRPGFDHHALMDEIDALLAEVLDGIVDYPGARRITYRDWFVEGAGLDPWLDTTTALRQFAAERLGEENLPALDEADRDGWLDLIVTHWLEPRCEHPAQFVYDYPSSQASLARVREGQYPVAERFELYLDGVELANGFHELTDASEQQQRFEADNHRRVQRGQAEMPVDTALIAALRHGLPDCSGVALGFDRLLMFAAGAASIDEVMPFGLSRV